MEVIVILGNSQVPAAKLALAKQLYADGHSLALAASRIGMSKTGLADLFRREGVPLRKAWETRSFKAPTPEIKRLYEQGALPSEIAARLGITKSAVASRLNRNHIPAKRGRGGVKGRLKNPEVRTEDIVAASRKGLNYSQIAEQFAITRTGVVYRLELAGCELPRKRRKVELAWNEIIGLYVNEQKSLENLAKQFQVGVNTIGRGLKKRRIKLRSRTQHMSSWHAERKRKLQEYEAGQSRPAKRGRGRPKGSVKPADKKRDFQVGQRYYEILPRFQALFAAKRGGQALGSFSRAEIEASNLGRLPSSAAKYFIAAAELHISYDAVDEALQRYNKANPNPDKQI